MNLDNLPFNWFDLVILITLFVGIQRGRKRGISEELLVMLKWLSIVIGCAFAYGPVGLLLSQSTTVISPLACYLIAYVGLAILIATAFAGLKKIAGGKLIGSDAFGRTEFYLGMLGGMVRFSCILVAALALLNARAYSAAEVKEELRYQNDVYGSNFFPTLHSLQAQVFEHSMAGPWIKQSLGPLLIKPVAPSGTKIKQKDYAFP